MRTLLEGVLPLIVDRSFLRFVLQPSAASPWGGRAQGLLGQRFGPGGSPRSADFRLGAWESGKALAGSRRPRCDVSEEFKSLILVYLF